MKYKIIIFDMDGTILDTLQDLTNSMNYALQAFSLPMRTIEEIRNFVGNGIKTLIERAVPDNTSVEMLEQVYQTFMPYYKLHNADETAPYDGIPELLTKLKQKGYKLAVVSNKANPAVQQLCQTYFPDLFDYALGESDSLPKKPAPDMVLHILETSGFSTKEAVYVGDSEVDVETAFRSGLEIIAVDWGFRSRDVLTKKGAKTIVSTPLEIFNCLLADHP